MIDLQLVGCLIGLGVVASALGWVIIGAIHWSMLANPKARHYSQAIEFIRAERLKTKGWRK